MQAKTCVYVCLREREGKPHSDMMGFEQQGGMGARVRGCEGEEAHERKCGIGKPEQSFPEAAAQPLTM